VSRIQREQHTVSISGLDYGLNVWDGGGETTVLLLHGYLDCGLNWSFLVDALGSFDWHVVAPDWRGHGESAWIGAGGYYHFTDYVRDLHQLVKFIGRKRVVVVGHSMGAMVAVHWLSTRPTNVIGCILAEAVGPQPLSADDYPKRLGQWLQQTAPFDPSKVQRPLRDLADASTRIARQYRSLPADRVRQIAINTTRKRVDGQLVWKFDPLHRTTAPMPGFPAITDAYLKAIECPLFWIGGENSLFLRPELHKWLDQAQNIAKVTLSDAGHMLHTENPLSLSIEVTRFIRSLDPSAAETRS